MIYLRMFCLVIVMLTVSTACGNSGTSGDAVPTLASIPEQNTNDMDSTEQQSAPTTGELPSYDLAEAGYNLNISGALSGGSGYTGTRSKVLQYSPYGTATNSEGATDVRMRWDATYNSTAYDVAVILILRDGITPGTHPIGDSISDDSSFDVRGRVDIDAMGVQDFDENVSGSLTLDVANREYANGTFEFSAENKDGEPMTVSGAFHLVPFSRNTDTEFTLSGAIDENFSDITTIGWNILQEDGIYDIHFNTVNSGLILKLPSDVSVGTYEVNTESTVSAEWDYNYPASGTVELTEAGDFYSGSLNLTATTDGGDVTITGTFEAIPSEANDS